MLEEPVLVFPNHALLFEVRMNAFNFTIGGVLIQGEHPIAFQNRKLNKAKRRYTVQEKEMTVMIHCLHTWIHYLVRFKFIVKMDNVVTSYFQSQKKPSLK